jgi:hypothetical protein
VNPPLVALRQARALCGTHAAVLADVLGELDAKGAFASSDLENPTKETRRILDQFAYRYLRLQDDMGARLFPAALRALGEDIAPMPALDRLARLEQLGWLPSADEWAELRRIRNEFAHDYPASAEEKAERLRLALVAARRLLEIFAFLETRLRQRFGAPPHDET